MKRLILIVVALLASPNVSSADYQVTWVEIGFRITIATSAGNLGDFDGDGLIEVVGFNESLNEVQIRDAITGNLEFSITMGIPGTIVVTDLDGDGTPEIMLYETTGSFTVRTVDFIGTALSTPDVSQRDGAVFRSFPNPVIQGATMVFSLEAPGEVDLRVYDVQGRLIKTVVSRSFVAGAHEVPWDGTSDTGQRLAAGTYFYMLAVDGKPVGTKKAVKLR